MKGCTTLGASTGLFYGAEGGLLVEAEDCDFSAASVVLHGGTVTTFDNIGFRAKLDRCRMPSGGGITANTGADTTGRIADEFVLTNCSDSSSTTAFFTQERHYKCGKTATVTSHRRVGGSDDGVQVNEYSQRLTAYANETVSRGGPHYSYVYVDLYVYVDGGASKTFTVNFAHNAVGKGAAGVVRDDQMWFELSGPSTDATTYADGYFFTSCLDPKESVAPLATATGQTWNGSTPTIGTHQKLAHTYTPQVDGVVKMRIFWAPDETTDEDVYVDCKIEIT